MVAQSFTDLIVWQKAHSFVLSIYKVTNNFPKEELYGLTAQIKRATVSISSNLAEGFVRHSKKEKAQFYYIALGSITEVQNQLLIARDLKFLYKKDFNALATNTIELSKLTNGLIRSLHLSS